MVSICKQSTRVWKVLDNIMGNFLIIPHNKTEDKVDENIKPLVAVDNKGENVIIYRGKLMFNMYQIENRNEWKLKERFDVKKELPANNSDGSFEVQGNRDVVVDDVAFMEDQPILFRVYLTINGNHFFADVRKDSVVELKRAERFSDQSIFAVDAEHNQQVLRSQHRMRTMANQQLELKNKVFFPSED